MAESDLFVDRCDASVFDVHAMSLRAVRLVEDAKLPKRAAYNVYDVYSAWDCTIGTQETGYLRTGIAMALPIGYYGRINPLNDLPYSINTNTRTNVIDNDFRGDLVIRVLNNAETALVVKCGDCIAQLMLYQETINPTFIEVKTVAALDVL